MEKHTKGRFFQAISYIHSLLIRIYICKIDGYHHYESTDKGITKCKNCGKIASTRV